MARNSSPKISGNYFLSSFVYFRAFAIIFIVAGHSYGLALFARDNPASFFAGNLITGGTTFFVVISGYLFHHVFYPRFTYRRFLEGKARNLLAPYLLLSTVAWILRHPLELGLAELIWIWLSILAKGSAAAGYWYIPFILLTFLISPHHVAFIQLSARSQIGILLLSLLVAAFVQKPIDDNFPLQAVITFKPAYLMGIFLSVHRNRALAILKRLDVYVFAAGVGLAALQTAIGHSGNYHSIFFTYSGIDLMLLQELLLSLAFFSFFERLASRGAVPRLINLIAQASFGVYFLHPFAIDAAQRSRLFPPTGLPALDLVLATLLVGAACVGAALAIKAVAGTRSRYLIGY
jgi:fucose 4-O-acetylase-like acetyltransferase